jgi:hypothetical protein
MWGAVWWESFGQRVIWFAAVVTALGLLSKTRLARYVWSHLVSEPASTWARTVIGEVVDAKVALPNGGSSVRDHIDNLAEQHVEMRDSIDAVRQWTEDAVAKSQERDAALESRFDDVNGRIDVLCSEIGELKHGKKGAA